MVKCKISWDTIHEDCSTLAKKVVAELETVNTIIGIAKGGLIPARILHEYIKPVNFLTVGVKLYEEDVRGDEVQIYQSLPSSNQIDPRYLGNILVVDDVCDSGKTFDFVTDMLFDTAWTPDKCGKIFTAAPYTKEGAPIKPYYHVR